ncbi:hypothetical protein L211DRAFT_837335 [Terfezia boudieri ATCC MYA-4762]|uniref:Uncharacterized protein n=1 Tax=Terfezia boudieri ATCC MYA-4762 TaxID=1051890 RepID=A0A3N4LNK1_9PEZI|nr:hypothetical protein L211DRAFT_837335 [Terfezia boudieri ATCC MYA-4762]
MTYPESPSQPYHNSTNPGPHTSSIQTPQHSISNPIMVVSQSQYHFIPFTPT